METIGVVVNIGSGFSARKERRLRAFESALRTHGADLHVFRTTRPGLSGTALTAAEKSGFRAVLAVGGDGTFNDLLQAAATAHSSMPIGVLPFGSGNILSQEIHRGGDLDAIAAHVASAPAHPVAIGRLTANCWGSRTARYFGVAAGIGADARVICAINPRLKMRFGIAAYYAESARQLLFEETAFPGFEVTFVDSETGQNRHELVTQVIVERVSYFGRCLAGRNGHGLQSEGFRLVLFKTNRRATFLAYGTRLLLARFSPRAHTLRDVEIAHAREITFTTSGDSAAPVFAEVDGEPVGELPAHIELIPAAVRLLLPGVDPCRDRPKSRRDISTGLR